MPRTSLLLLALAAPPLLAQDASSLYADPDRQPVRVRVAALGLAYEDGEVGARPSQLAVPVSVSAPLGPLALSARTTYARAEWAGREGLNGLGDVQVVASGIVPVGQSSAVLSLSANLPTGQRALTPGEAATAYRVGQAFYDFPLPTWGQGLNLAPGLTVAVPISDGLAVGAGIAYQYRGAFEPLAETSDAFDPGDEVMVSTGADMRVTPTTIAALDVSYVMYATDTFGAREFDVGDALSATTEVTTTMGTTEVRLLGRVRVRGDGETAPVLTEPEATVPLHARLRGEARVPLGPSLGLGVVAQGRYYEASEAFESHTLLDVLARPEYRTSGLAVQGQIGATLGTLPGLRYGLSVTYEL